MYFPQKGLLTSIRKIRGGVRGGEGHNHVSSRYEKDHDDAMELYYEEKTEEPNTCKHFGCGRELTAQESLYGDRCVKHSGEMFRKDYKIFGKLEAYL